MLAAALNRAVHAQAGRAVKKWWRTQWCNKFRKSTWGKKLQGCGGVNQPMCGQQQNTARAQSNNGGCKALKATQEYSSRRGTAAEGTRCSKGILARSGWAGRASSSVGAKVVFRRGVLHYGNELTLVVVCVCKAAARHSSWSRDTGNPRRRCTPACCCRSAPGLRAALWPPPACRR